jgi:hypothetical protein
MNTGRGTTGCRGGPGHNHCPRHGGGQWFLAQALLPAPPHTHLSLTDPDLEANSYLKVMVPKRTNVTFWEQKKKKKSLL